MTNVQLQKWLDTDDVDAELIGLTFKIYKTLIWSKKYQHRHYIYNCKFIWKGPADSYMLDDGDIDNRDKMVFDKCCFEGQVFQPWKNSDNGFMYEQLDG